MNNSKPTTVEIGRYGESLARRYLVKKNLQIVKNNYKVCGGEIDIIAYEDKKDLLIFVEVKTRTLQNFGKPEEAVTEQKKQNLKRAALRFLSENKYPAFQNYRFDCLSVELNFKNHQAKITHYKYI